MMAEEKVLKCRKWTTFLRLFSIRFVFLSFTAKFKQKLLLEFYHFFLSFLRISLSFPMKNGEVKYADGA